MRTRFLALFVAISACAHGAESPPEKPQPLYAYGTDGRSFGRTIIWIGAGGMVASFGMTAAGFSSEEEPGNRWGAPVAASGLLIGFASVAVLTWGIIEWALGVHDQHEAERRGYFPP
ncbi:MAG TPA: hypothetical protein VKN99_11550 [Polyangia bacterium]|nr:hypothetical protein [Polyangia bacterium]